MSLAIHEAEPEGEKDGLGVEECGGRRGRPQTRVAVFDLRDERQQPEIKIELRHGARKPAFSLVEAYLEHAHRRVTVDSAVPLFEHVPKDLEVFFERLGRIGLQRVEYDGRRIGLFRPEALDDLGADPEWIAFLPRRRGGECGHGRNGDRHRPSRPCHRFPLRSLHSIPLISGFLVLWMISGILEQLLCQEAGRYPSGQWESDPRPVKYPYWRRPAA